jgi:endonuclease YncB( thermonuclease family)
MVRASDGDTLLLATPQPGGPRLIRARLIGLNAPFLTTPEGEHARSYVLSSLVGRPLVAEFGERLPTDQRSRWHVYLWRDGASVNEDLLERGLASVRPGKNKRFEKTFWAAELRAKQKGVGVWNRCPEPEFAR